MPTTLSSTRFGGVGWGVCLMTDYANTCPTQARLMLPDTAETNRPMLGTCGERGPLKGLVRDVSTYNY